MKQLHTSYNNLGSWRSISTHDATSIRYNPKQTIITSIVVSIISLCAAYGMSTLDSSNPDGMKFGIGFLIFLALIYPIATACYIVSQAKKGDLIRFTPSTNTLDLPRQALSISDASNRVHFSQEHYTDGNNHYFEFNIVIDGERTKFLSSSVANGFKSVRSSLDKLGFYTINQKVRL